LLIAFYLLLTSNICLNPIYFKLLQSIGSKIV